MTQMIGSLINLITVENGVKNQVSPCVTLNDVFDMLIYHFVEKSELIVFSCLLKYILLN